jgi:hypothetical protein
MEMSRSVRRQSSVAAALGLLGVVAACNGQQISAPGDDQSAGACVTPGIDAPLRDALCAG